MQIFFDFQSTSASGAFFSRYGFVGVDVFFVLSGFVMYLVAKNSIHAPASFLVNRIFRIAPNYWFYTAIVVLGIYCFPRGFSYTGFAPLNAFASLMFLPSTNPSGIGIYPLLTVGWTLNFEMFFYVALACCIAASTKHYLKILFITFATLPLIYPKDSFFSQIAASFALYEFLAGGLLAIIWSGKAGAAIRLHQTRALVIAVVGMLGGAILLVLNGDAIFFSAAIVAVTVLCEPYLSVNNHLVKALVRLGDQSYSTYLAHCIVIGIAFHFFGTSRNQAVQLATLAGIILGVSAMSSLSYRWLECSRHIDLMRRAVIQRMSGFPGNSFAANNV